MARIMLVLIVAAIIESVGVIILTRGLKEVQGAREITVSEIARVARSVVTNGKIIAGTALEAIFYAALLYMLSKSDVSFIWPLTSLGFIFTTLAAEFILGEKVAATRWAGVLFIAFGVSLISYSEKVKGTEAPPPPPNSASLRPQ
jgi:drug/metabolite transporter (DMT)-like permease